MVRVYMLVAPLQRFRGSCTWRGPAHLISGPSPAEKGAHKGYRNSETALGGELSS